MYSFINMYEYHAMNNMYTMWCVYLPSKACSCRLFNRGKRLHTRNRHLRNHRGCSVAVPNGCSVAFSNGFSLFSCMFKRIVAYPVDLYWNFPMNVQWHFPKNSLRNIQSRDLSILFSGSYLYCSLRDILSREECLFSQRPRSSSRIWKTTHMSCTCICMYICVYLYIYIYIYVYTHIHICICMYIYIYIHIHIVHLEFKYVYIHICIYTHLNVCCIHIIYVSLYIYIYIYTYNMCMQTNSNNNNNISRDPRRGSGI